MRFGVHLPNSGGGAVSPDSLVDYRTIKEIVVEAEKLGFDSVWANEHLTLPTDQTPVETKFYEPITLLSSLSSQTSKIVLGTAIVILPFRDPFALAKETFTLAEISGDRFVLGVGPGRFEREYSTQSKNWSERNKILEEQIRLIRELRSGGVVNYAGKYYSALDLSMRPIPKKLPIVLGGSGEVALKRAVRFCDGIMPGHITVEQASTMHEAMNNQLESSMTTSVSKKQFTFYNEIILSIDHDDEKAKSKFLDSTYVRKVPYATNLSSKALIGSPQEIEERIKKYRGAGIQEFVLIFADETKSSFIESMELFSSRIMKEMDAD